MIYAISREEIKTFDNIKDLNDYLRNHAGDGETVRLDERATVTHPRRIKEFTKSRRHEG